MCFEHQNLSFQDKGEIIPCKTPEYWGAISCDNKESEYILEWQPTRLLKKIKYICLLHDWN